MISGFIGRQPAVTLVCTQVPLAAVASTLRQAAVYLPSRRASPPFDRYQVILLGDRGNEQLVQGCYLTA